MITIEGMDTQIVELKEATAQQIIDFAEQLPEEDKDNVFRAWYAHKDY